MEGRPTSGMSPLWAVIIAATLHQVHAAEEAVNADKAVGVSVAATLIGAISFIMCLYYFLNWKDEDIRCKSWELVSQIISIFCAVLLFQSFNDLVEFYIIKALHLDLQTEAMIDLGHFVFWYIILQVALFSLSGAQGGVERIKHLSPLEQDKDKERRLVNLKCFATLLAHLTGFASINAWGTVQHLPFFSYDWFSALLAVPMALVGQVVLQRITDCFRERVSLQGDGFKDIYERMWDSETEEAENDVMGLTLSFLLTNALRYGITGCFPNQEGKEEDGPGCVEGALYKHSYGEKFQLVMLGLIFAVIIFTIRVSLPEWLFEEEEEDSDEEVAEEITREKREKQEQIDKWEFIKRLAEACFTAISMSFSWCAFFGMQMILAGYTAFQGEENAELSQVVLALSLSYAVFAVMIGLDKIADSGQQKGASKWAQRGAEGIRNIMNACSLLVGFAWEQCFDQSVDSLAEEATPGQLLNPHTAKLILSVFCASLLVPAWRAYMLPYIVAKGWRYGSVLHPDHIGHLAKQMIEHPDIPPNSKRQRERIKRIMDGLQAVPHLKRVMGGGDSYARLPEDDVGALKKENAELRRALDKANTEIALKSRALDVMQQLKDM